MLINPKVVDISHYDDVHAGGFSLLRRAGYIGVIGKATQGPGMTDKTYRLRLPIARDAGLLYGAYHYLTKGPIKNQVDHFLDVVRPDNQTLLAVDHEDRAVSLAAAQEFCERVNVAAGRYPILYSGFLVKEQIKKADYKFWSGIKLWLSHYNAKPKWPDAWKEPWLWQFTGDGTGPMPHEVPGISIVGGMDINSWAGTDDELRAQWAK